MTLGSRLEIKKAPEGALVKHASYSLDIPLQVGTTL